MGAKNSSPRTVQLENDTPATVIEVSDAVVDRLKGLHSRGNLGIGKATIKLIILT